MKQFLMPMSVFCIFLFLAGCGASHPSIGKTVNYNWPTICVLEKDPIQPSSCHITLTDFDFKFDVEHAGENEYNISGTAHAVEPEISSRIHSGKFTFLFITHGKIVEAVSLSPKGDLGTRIPFRKNFKIKGDFDAITVTYKIVYQT